MNVKRPQVTINAKTGSVGIIDNGPDGNVLTLGGSPLLGGPGISFRIEGETNVGGTFKWAQLVDANFGLGPDGIWVLEDGLDTVFPYATGTTAVDTPSITLDGPGAGEGVHNYAWYQNDFAMFLLWEPPTGGELVPLRLLIWSIDTGANWNNGLGKWKLGTTNSWTGYDWDAESYNTTSHPTWNNLVE